MQRRLLFIILLALSLAACTDDGLEGLSVEQRELIGRAVNFNPTRVDAFATRVTYDDTGAFNEDDLMRIYRQYYDNGTWGTDADYRTYVHNTKYATGTTISLGKDWRVYVGRKGYNIVADALHQTAGTFTQEEKDSITWDKGGTVRFRSWTRSNYDNCLTNCYKWYGSDGLTNYYPDFCVSDWVTVSGPTEQIPLNMRHICSRIVFSRRNDGNEFHHVEVDTIWQDYKRIDNADFNDNDNDEAGKSDDDAKEECNQVLAAYRRMCMPAGVDIERGELHAMLKGYWNNLYYEGNETPTVTHDSLRSSRDYLPKLEEQPASSFYHFGAKDANYIHHYVQRPVFANVNGSCYLLTIPYDMSNGENKGDIITLPACTRFRVYLRDVNNGDGNNTNGYEGNYHIFSLQDIVERDADGNIILENGKTKPKFPNGLELLPGYSYRFWVGYRYKQLTITADDHFSWEQQDRENDNFDADIHAVPEPTTADYGWWKETIRKAIPTNTGGDFNPVFHIETQQQFIEFINLVNGTAAKKTSGLTRAKRGIKNPDHEGNTYDEYNWWYSSISANKRDTTWVTSAEATADGYLLYQSYHAANANQPAYSEEEYIREPYPFYDETRNRHYTVYLDNDLDLYDWQLESIGGGNFWDAEKKRYITPFMGYFDGQNHTLRNLNMQEEYLFKQIESAAIRNLRIESTHKVSLVKEGTETNYIVGIDLRAHSTLNSIAERLTSNDYNNPSYVVGCIHVGDAGGALVGASDNLYMYGCMQAAEGIPSGKGALLGAYLTAPHHDNGLFFRPRISFNYNDMSQELKGTPSWGRFSCNYYDTELSRGTNAVGDIADLYSPLEYIRGRESFILKAKNDNLVKGDASFNTLTSISQRMAFYGLAPWKAMNYGIYKYNQTAIGSSHPCNAHYENDSTGYIHRYPELKATAPAAGQYANPLEQNN